MLAGPLGFRHSQARDGLFSTLQSGHFLEGASSTLKSMAKRKLERFLPRAMFYWNAGRRRHYLRKEPLARRERHKQMIFKGDDPYVLAGPFTGLRYLNEHIWGPNRTTAARNLRTGTNSNQNISNNTNSLFRHNRCWKRGGLL